MLRDWQPALSDLEDGPVIWLALATLQHDHGCLQKSVKSKALDIINRGTDLKHWEAAQDRDSFRRRKSALERLRAKLDKADTSENSTLKRPRPLRQRFIELISNWPMDELFSYRLPSGRLAILHVVHHFGSKQSGHDPVFAVLNWRGKRVPSAARLRSIPLRTKVDKFRGREVFMIAVGRLSESELPGDRITRLNITRSRHVKSVHGGFFACRWKDFDEHLQYHLGWE